ncbi:hypothetical protein NQ117_16465 [Paenibacillus sp. SC116]|uniref:hypothetical protein n=1 Tax=Paenibacillus sp. SC116 TaxID=2968986 RepID=UPI00215A4788|nr:hypothetical protein [Paenibacillus sp. SC116]MCR8845280.1 hypothetical protein [Paenibacillus sp. SC116]
MQMNTLAPYKRFVCGLTTACLLFSMLPISIGSSYTAHAESLATLPTDSSTVTSSPLHKLTAKQPTTAAELLKYEAQQAHRAARCAWPALDKLWPGLQFQSRVMLLTNGEQTYEITTEGYKLVDPSHPGLPLDLYFNHQYEKLEWNGKQASAIFVDKDKPLQERFEPHTSTPSSFMTTTHEMFHFYDQPSWPLEDGTQYGSRSSIYPTESKPRIQRAMLFQSLYKAYSEPQASDKYLGHAAYWHEQYKQDNPTEYKSSIYFDIIEGTATYVEKMADVYGAFKRSATTEQIRTYLSKQYTDVIKTEFVTFDSESYILGSLSALLLDAMHKDWKHSATKGHNPIELLLNGITPLSQPVDEQIKSDIEATIGKLNAERAISLEPLKKGLDDKQIPLLLIPREIKRGIFSTRGFITLKGYEQGSVIMNMTTKFTTNTGDLELTERSMLRKYTTVETQEGDYLITPLPEGEYARAGDTLTFAQNGLKGTVKVRAVKYDGREAFIVLP